MRYPERDVLQHSVHPAATESLTITPETWLDGLTDMERTAQETPADFRVKGIFFARMLQLIRDDWPTVAGRLEAPADNGRYVPFRDYPWRDYTRLMAMAARQAHPNVPSNEALRRLGWDDHDLFAGTATGKVTLALVGTPRQAILHTPSVYLKMAPGERRMEATELDAMTLQLEVEPNYGAWPYMVGQFQGITSHYGPCPTIVVEHFPPRRLRLTFYLAE